MKKIIMLSSALFLLSSYSADAQVSVTFGEAPVYEAPPVYYTPTVYAPSYVEYNHRYPSQYYDMHHQHRHNDMAYWSNHHRQEDARDHREHDDHDNGNHGHR